MNADEVKVGGYQVLTLLMLCVNLVVVGMSHAISIFYKHKPEFHCQGDENVNINDEDVSNVTYSCLLTSCSQGIYYDEANRTSIATEWNLICENSKLLDLSGDVYFGGMLLGGIIAGFLMDRIGRMPILAICLYAQGTMSVALNIVQHYKLFLVFRGLQGFFMQGLEISTYILGIELFPNKYRTLLSLIILSMRSIGFAVLAGLSYAVLDWRVLQLIISIPTALSVTYVWLIPESVRWLLSRQRLTDAEIVIERIANYNNFFSRRNTSKEIPPEKPKRKAIRTDDDDEEDEYSTVDVEKSAEAENLLEGKVEEGKIDSEEITSLEDKEQPNQSYLMDTKEDEEEVKDVNEKKVKGSIVRFFEVRFIGRSCLILMCLWFACSVAFHSLITLPRSKIDRHASLAIAGAVEIVTFSFGYLLISSRFGRRIPLCVGQIFAGTICLGMAILSFVQSEEEKQDKLILHGKIAVVKIGAVANIICFFVLRILTIELFPTISRGTGVGLCVAAEMLAGLYTPWFLKLNEHFADGKKDVSRISTGIFCICVAFLTLILSETVRMKTLPDSVEDAKIVEQNKNGKCNNADAENPEKLRKKLFSEDWVDAGNGIIVNFTENKTVD